MTYPSIAILCNDPYNGLFAGFAETIQVGSLELEARSRRAPSLVQLPGGIRLAGKYWPTHRRSAWVGDWCWNAYSLGTGQISPRWEITRFLTWLQGRGLYDCTCGPTALQDWWNDCRARTPVDLHARVCGLFLPEGCDA